MTETPRNGSMVKSGEKTFEIVEILKRMDGAGVTEIADRMDVSKSTVYKHLQTLVTHDYATKVDGEYRVGLRFLDHGIYARQQQTIYRISRDRIDELAEETGELAWCQTHEHGRCVYLYGAAGVHSVHPPERVGNRTPMHQIAGGKAMLAHLPEERIGEILDRHGLEPATPHTITERAELFDELEGIRERGISYNREESNEGLYAVASAVLGPDGEVLGAIGLSGPKHRLEGELIETEFPELLLGTANELELNLEHQEFSTDGGSSPVIEG